MTFDPDWAVHPGEVLLETLDELGWSQHRLAKESGISAQHVSRICRGQVGISAEVALKLERATGMMATLWVDLDARYRLRAARDHEQRITELRRREGSR